MPASWAAGTWAAAVRCSHPIAPGLHCSGLHQREARLPCIVCIRHGAGSRRALRRAMGLLAACSAHPPGHHVYSGFVNRDNSLALHWRSMVAQHNTALARRSVARDLRLTRPAHDALTWDGERARLSQRAVAPLAAVLVAAFDVFHIAPLLNDLPHGSVVGFCHAGALSDFTRLRTCFSGFLRTSGCSYFGHGP